MLMSYTTCDAPKCTAKTESERSLVHMTPVGWGILKLNAVYAPNTSQQRDMTLCPKHLAEVEAVVGEFDRSTQPDR